MGSKKLGFLQAIGVTAYCLLVGLIFWKGSDVFGKMHLYLGPVAVLILLSVSVLICALLVFYNPYKLFFGGKKKEAVDTVVYTTASLFIFLLLAFLLMFLIK
jgi:hypothetical protein